MKNLIHPVLLTCLLAGCASAKGGGGEERTIESYSPLKKGATYVYDVKYPGQSGEMTVAIVGEEDGFFVDSRQGYFAHTPEGLRDKDRYLIRYPLVSGNKWKSVTGASAVEHYEIISVGEPCSSSAGQFSDCIVVQGKIRRDANMSLEIRWTWAKNVGLTKLETTAEIKGKGALPQVTQSLKFYDLEGKTKLAPTPPPPPPGAAPSAPPPDGTEESDDGPAEWESE